MSAAASGVNWHGEDSGSIGSRVAAIVRAVKGIVNDDDTTCTLLKCIVGHPRRRYVSISDD